jgi:cell shape-determining protein MreD
VAVRLPVVWGFALLSGLSYLVARTRSVSAFGEIWKHGSVAVVVILISKGVGVWILKMIGPA